MLLPGAGNLVIEVPHVAVSLRPAHSVALLAAKIASKARVVALTQPATGRELRALRRLA
jgi:hypothetical protein